MGFCTERLSPKDIENIRSFDPQERERVRREGFALHNTDDEQEGYNAISTLGIVLSMAGTRHETPIDQSIIDDVTLQALTTSDVAREGMYEQLTVLENENPLLAAKVIAALVTTQRRILNSPQAA